MHLFEALPKLTQYGAGTLDAYSETGDSMLALHYNDNGYNYSNIATGLKVSHPFVVFDKDTFEPFVKYEQIFGYKTAW